MGKLSFLRSRVGIAVRWLLAVWLAVSAFRALAGAASVGSLIASPQVLLGIALMLGAFLLVAPEFVIPICDWFGSLFENIIYPSEQFSKPELSYVLARFYRQQLRFEESTYEYEEIIHYYPEERPAYEELLEMAGATGDLCTFRKYSRKFKRRFGEERSAKAAGTKAFMPDTTSQNEAHGLDARTVVEAPPLVSTIPSAAQPNPEERINEPSAPTPPKTRGRAARRKRNRRGQ